MRYRIHGVQGMEFEELVVEARSEEDAKRQYDQAWDNGDISSLEYLEDEVRYVITKDK